MNRNRLELRDLSICTTDAAPRILVDSINLTLEPGCITALVGQSGAGKSLTALATMGLLPVGTWQAQGTIVLGDVSMNDLNAEEWRRLRNHQISMIVQNPASAFDPLFTIWHNFMETSRSHYPSCSRNDIRCRAIRALTEAGFTHAEQILPLYPFQMSGGMLQKTMIALALLTDPSFLIADEPTANLDQEAKEAILALLKERQRARGLGLLIITHDLDAAARMADKVAVMRHGAIIEHDSSATVFSQPRHPYAQELIDAYHALGRSVIASCATCHESGM